MPTGEYFELIQWLSLNSIVYLVGLQQFKNYQHLQKFIHQNKYQKLNLVYIDN